MKLNFRYIFFDFLFGGALVAGALLMASLLGPAFGGIVAGAPIRTGGVVFLEYLHNGHFQISVQYHRVLAQNPERNAQVGRQRGLTCAALA